LPTFFNQLCCKIYIANSVMPVLHYQISIINYFTQLCDLLPNILSNIPLSNSEIKIEMLSSGETSILFHPAYKGNK
jgi:hypothetical protein